MRQWRPVHEMDTSRVNHCHIRLADGTELKAFWGTGTARYKWLCSDGQMRNLFEIDEYEIISSMPYGSLPGGKCTDAELLADSLDMTPQAVEKKYPFVKGKK
jgi:hypothetical protein